MATLFITMGDPAGVGPEVICRALAALGDKAPARLVVVGSREVLEQAGHVTGAEIRWAAYRGPGAAPPQMRGFELIDLANVDRSWWQPGRLDARCGQAAYEYIEEAVRRCRAGEGQGLVTAPINKAAVNAAGHHFAGHTEILAHLLGVRGVAMMLVTPTLRVVHVSTHCSLAQAIERVRPERIERVAELLIEALEGLGIADPRVAVAGLNPHAGEGGLFGEEEDRYILPAIESLKGRGFSAFGPEPPDTVFLRAVQGQFDGVVAMYHDQGHIAVKTLGFSQGVNVTLGLPLIRTSVGHGTAFNIAGTGRAYEGSMLAAIELGAEMAARHE